MHSTLDCAVDLEIFSVEANVSVAEVISEDHDKVRLPIRPRSRDSAGRSLVATPNRTQIGAAPVKEQPR